MGGLPWGGARFARPIDGDLTVVPMRGWRRAMNYVEAGLPWVMPSPNMPTPTTALVYPGQCLFEGTNLSEGRGTTRPFEIVGAPFLDGYDWVAALGRMAREELPLPGVRFRPLSFRPMFHKFAGRSCGGVQLHVTDRATFRPYATGIALLATARRLAPDDFRWRTEPYEFVADPPAIDLLTGSAEVRLTIEGDGKAGIDRRAGGELRAVRAGLRRASPRGVAPRLSLIPMRVALFGGSFNPPHVAHQMVALYVLETAGVDELWMVPAFQHPFDKSLAPFDHRLAMCEAAAVALGRRVKVSAVERDLGVESRTLRTVRRLQQEFPAHTFSLVIGADLIHEVPTWYAGEELQRTVPFIVVGRTGFDVEGKLALPRLSSTEVRDALLAGRSVDGLVSRSVLDYIQAHNLYKNGLA